MIESPFSRFILNPAAVDSILTSIDNVRCKTGGQVFDNYSLLVVARVYKFKI